MRIIAGQWRGRVLATPAGTATRPTSDRVRQALFDMLLHAPWGGRAAVEGAAVLDAFAGSGALGLEALSRGAAHAVFFDTDRAALTAIGRNVAMLGAAADLRAADALAPPPTPAPRQLVFLDPPYGDGMVPRAVAALAGAGWIAPGTLVLAETERDAALPFPLLADRVHGKARLRVWRA